MYHFFKLRLLRRFIFKHSSRTVVIDIRAPGLQQLIDEINVKNYKKWFQTIFSKLDSYKTHIDDALAYTQNFGLF